MVSHNNAYISLTITRILGIFCIIVLAKIYCIATQRSCISLPRHPHFKLHRLALTQPCRWFCNSFSGILFLISATLLAVTFIPSLDYPSPLRRLTLQYQRYHSWNDRIRTYCLRLNRPSLIPLKLHSKFHIANIWQFFELSKFFCIFFLCAH